MRQHTCSTLRTIRRTVLTLLLAALLASPQPTAHAATSLANEASARQTMEIFQTIPGLTGQQLEQGR